MDEKLYPPYLENTIPAFYKTDDGITIKVPFSMNRTVSDTQVRGYVLVIKSVSTNTPLLEGNYLFSDSYSNNIVEFKVISSALINKIHIGQFYKVQLAYMDLSGTVGIFSNASVAKCTVLPKLSIKGLSESSTNFIFPEYRGGYFFQSIKSGEDQGLYDTSERVLYYSFNIYDSSYNLLWTSDEQVHNSSLDDISLKVTYDSIKIPFAYKKNETYFLEYKVKTINGLEVSSPLYAITERDTVDMPYSIKLLVSCYPDNGFIKVQLKNITNEIMSGNFIISRRQANYEQRKYMSYQKGQIQYDWSPWEELWKISLKDAASYSESLKDFTVEQGIYYQYSIQEYNQYDIYSNRILSEPIKADFEDMFLYDGKHQLRIRFNPQIQSFKNTVLEQKVDTIGGKHPFIFRNGQVKYKEFPISGLISYLIDGNISYSTTGEIDDQKYYFFEPDDLRNNEKIMKRASSKSKRKTQDAFPFFPSTNLTSDNITIERMFKLKVMDWLTNGEPKLFRSPTEGNYLVRVLNVSLSPNDTLGRMIHTFQGQAYEIADFNCSNLVSFGFFNIDSASFTPTWSVKSTLLWDKDGDKSGVTPIFDDGYQRKPKKVGNILDHDAINLHFHDVTPGAVIRIDNRLVTIGQSGDFYFNAVEAPVKTVSIISPNYLYGALDYSYTFKNLQESDFDVMKKVSLFNVINEQIYGDDTIRIDSIEKNENQRVKKVIQNYTKIKFLLRPVYRVKKIEDLTEVYDYQKMILNNDSSLPIQNERTSSFEVGENGFLIDPFGIYLTDTEEYYCFEDGGFKKITNYSPYVTLVFKNDNETLDLNTNEILDLNAKEEINLENMSDISFIKIGSGVLMETSYTGVKYKYSGESDNE